MYGTRICQLGEKDILSALHELSRHFHGAAHRCLPEREIEHMMQAERDQRAFDDTEDQRAEISRPCHQAAKRIDPILNKGPEEIHHDPHAHVRDRGNDRDKP